MAVFSDNLIHDIMAVFLIQEIIIDYLKKSFDFVRKIIYFTDGAAQNFKNKHNFQNFLHHYEDFFVEADCEWNFCNVGWSYRP